MKNKRGRTTRAGQSVRVERREKKSPCASALLLPLGEGATLRGQRRESSKKAPSSELLNLSFYLLKDRVRNASRPTNRDAVGVQREVEQRTFALWLIRIEHAFADGGVAEHLGGLGCVRLLTLRPEQAITERRVGFNRRIRSLAGLDRADEAHTHSRLRRNLADR